MTEFEQEVRAIEVMFTLSGERSLPNFDADRLVCRSCPRVSEYIGWPWSPWRKCLRCKKIWNTDDR